MSQARPRARVRTRHVDERGAPRFTNRLADETSPYLLQHAHNPVPWWPWGDAAFAEAARRDVPVFLSIGYASCHWCHVMEEESFDDTAIGAVLSEYFVCVKVDREERPDVDSVYMTALQALTGKGGWPLSAWLDPRTRAPFFCGTYLPPNDGDRGVAMGLRSTLLRIAELWRADRARVTASAATIAAELAAHAAPPPPGDAVGLDVIDDLVARVAARFDGAHGGGVGAPKFPSQTPLRALFRHSARTGQGAGKDMALRTLRAMLDGGVYDQLGGGLFRYSVDESWLVPHFEKLLGDSALLVPPLLDALQLSGDAHFERAARQTLAFIDRDLSLPSGAFASALDADSADPHGLLHEGRAYTFTPDEVAVELGARGFSDADTRIVCACLGISAGGHVDGRSVVHLPRPLAEQAARVGRVVADVEALVARARDALLVARSERPAPARDDKAVTASNALAISAFAHAALVLDDDALLARARRAYVAVRVGAGMSDGRVRRVAAGAAAGVLDDHAFLCRAALDLFSASGDHRFLDDALALDAVLARDFEDERAGGFFFTARDAEALLVRTKPERDGAEPSGNSVHAENLARLALLTDDDAIRRRADRCVRALSQRLKAMPTALPELTLAVELEEASREVVVSVPARGAPLDEEGALLVSVVRRRYFGAHVLVWLHGEDAALAARVPLVRDRTSDGRATVYVCEGGACRLPARSSRALMDALGRGGG